MTATKGTAQERAKRVPSDVWDHIQHKREQYLKTSPMFAGESLEATNEAAKLDVLIADEDGNLTHAEALAITYWGGNGVLQIIAGSQEAMHAAIVKRELLTGQEVIPIKRQPPKNPYTVIGMSAGGTAPVFGHYMARNESDAVAQFMATGGGIVTGTLQGREMSVGVATQIAQIDH